MPLVERTRPRVGDIVEIDLGSGFAYVQKTHKHAQYGALLRVFFGVYEKRPLEFLHIAGQPVQFTTFFPLGVACSRGIVKVVANEEVKEPREFPVFRTGVVGKSGKIEAWWLWDGERERKVGSLSEGMERLPIRGVVNDSLLIERIRSGWRHEDVV